MSNKDKILDVFSDLAKSNPEIQNAIEMLRKVDDQKFEDFTADVKEAMQKKANKSWLT